MELASSQSYANFRAWVPRNILPIGVRHPQSWLFYDWGPRSYPEPLICLHSMIGSAESFFPQLISLPPRGYRVLSIQIPVYWTITEFCDAFQTFLDAVSINRFHFYGAGLGGFLALHYAARQPERVASVALTHSFLSTENLNLRIPYSPSVLKWLPDFLIRSTMRAILPKGRASLSIANAAEFAIGHTMDRPRDEIASRMALSITSSSVMSRLHIPQTAITLIDTVDRVSPAMLLSQQTAAQLSGARRALLKEGGDFPYLAASDDVNVHLIVHMRRNGPAPRAPLPLPPPARPRPLPLSAIRRREAEKRRRAAATREDSTKENDQTENINGNINVKPDRPHRTDAERETEVHAIVAAKETGSIERYTFEIGRLREFLPEKDDAYLAAVIVDCEENLDMAISRALEDVYTDEFYDQTKERMMMEAREQVLLAEEEESEEMGASSDEEKEGLLEQQQSTIAADDMDSTTQRSYTIGSITENRTSLQSEERSVDPLGSNHSQNIYVDHPMNDENDVPQRTDVQDSSPGMITGTDNESTSDAMTDEQYVGMRPTRRSRSSLTQIDLTTEDEVSGLKSPVHEQSSTLDINDDDTVTENNGGKRQRRSRRRASPHNNDAHETLVGRGPEPFNDAPGDTNMAPRSTSWMSGDGEETEGGESAQESEGKNGTTTPSGASLLETGDNPLDLPSPDMRYSSRTHRRQQSSRGFPASSTKNHVSTGNNQTPTKTDRGDHPFFSWRSLFPQHNSEPTASPDKDRDAVEDALSPSSSRHYDEWESFRNGTEQDNVGQSGTQIDIPTSQANPLETVKEEISVTEDIERLREWSMSAHTASKSVKRSE